MSRAKKKCVSDHPTDSSFSRRPTQVFFIVRLQSAQSLQKHCKIALYERFSLVDDKLIMSCDQQLIRVYS